MQQPNRTLAEIIHHVTHRVKKPGLFYGTDVFLIVHHLQGSMGSAWNGYQLRRAMMAAPQGCRKPPLALGLSGGGLRHTT